MITHLFGGKKIYLFIFSPLFANCFQVTYSTGPFSGHPNHIKQGIVYLNEIKVVSVHSAYYVDLNGLFKFCGQTLRFVVIIWDSSILHFWEIYLSFRNSQI